MCRGRIAGYKVPKDVRFVADADLPRSTSGKVKRHELEQLLIEESAPAGNSSGGHRARSAFSQTSALRARCPRCPS